MLSPNSLSPKLYAASSKAQPEHGSSQKPRPGRPRSHGLKPAWKVRGIQYGSVTDRPSIMSVFGPRLRTELQSLRRDNPQSLWNHVTLSFTKSFWLKLRSLSFQGWPSGPSDLQAWDFWRFFWRLDKVSQKSGSQKVRLWKSFKQRS